MKAIPVTALSVLMVFLTACQAQKPTTPQTPTTSPSRISNQTIDDAIKAYEPAPAPPVSVPEFLVQKFQLTQAVGTDNDDKINQSLSQTQVLVDLSGFPKGYAYMGCNHINFQVALNKNTFKIGNIASTRMFCPSVVSLEMTLAKQVQAVKWYAVEDDTLVLYGEQVKLYFKPVS